LVPTFLLENQTARKLTIKNARSKNSQPGGVCQAEEAAKKIGGTAQWIRQRALVQAPIWSGLGEEAGTGFRGRDMNLELVICNVVAKIDKLFEKCSLDAQ
jgi:hypothetical protein